MTWSLIARDGTGALGVVVASRFFAVGALCPHAASGVGALVDAGARQPDVCACRTGAMAKAAAPGDIVHALTAPTQAASTGSCT